MKPTHLIKAVNGYKYFAYRNELGMWIDHGTGYVIHYHRIAYVEPIEETQEPETFDCYRAMRLAGDGVEVERWNDAYQEWRAVRSIIENDRVVFMLNTKYRRKPQGPVVRNVYEAIHSDGTGNAYNNLGICISNTLNALAHLEITYNDEKPVSVRLIEKDSK